MFLRRSKPRFLDWSRRFRGAEQNCHRYSLTLSKIDIQFKRYISVRRFLKMASAAEAGRTQTYGSPRALSIFREKTPAQGKDQSWSLNLILLPMLRSVSPAARSPRPNRDFSPLNFTQVGMVAVGAIRLKRKTLPLGINEWPEEVIQEKLLELVTRANVDVEVILSRLLCPN